MDYKVIGVLAGAVAFAWFYYYASGDNAFLFSVLMGASAFVVVSGLLETFLSENAAKGEASGERGDSKNKGIGSERRRRFGRRK